MPQFLANLIKQDIIYLMLSLIVFPVSLELALVCFIGFLAIRINCNYFKEYKMAIKILLGIIITLATFKLFAESRSTFYPVSYIDYLLLLITVSIIRQNPIKIKSIYQICWGINLSLMVVFVCYLPTLNFSERNHWGFGNPNWLGLYCSTCFPLTLCMLIDQLYRYRVNGRSSKKSTKLLLAILIVALIANSIMIVSSGSRSSLYTSLLIAIVILLKLLSRCSISFFEQPKLLVYLSYFLSGATLIYQFFLTQFSFLNRFIEIGNSTNIYRIKLYKCHLALWMQKPWGGWGVNNATVICEQKLGARYGGVNHAHNFILQLLVDHGLIITLFSLVIVFYFLIFPTITLIAKHSFNSTIDILHLGISGSSLSILIVSLFQSGFYHYPLFPLWLGLLWGCQLSLIKHQRNHVVNWQKQVIFPVNKNAVQPKI